MSCFVLRRFVADQLAVPVEPAAVVDRQAVEFRRRQRAKLLRPFGCSRALRRHDARLVHADLGIWIRAHRPLLPTLPNRALTNIRQFTLMFAALMTGAQRAISPSMRARNSAGRIADRLHQLRGKLVADRRRPNCFYHLALNSRNDGLRRMRRRDHAHPGVGIDVDTGLLQRRNLRQIGRSLRGRDRENLDRCRGRRAG